MGIMCPAQHGGGSSQSAVACTVESKGPRKNAGRRVGEGRGVGASEVSRRFGELSEPARSQWLESGTLAHTTKSCPRCLEAPKSAPRMQPGPVRRDQLGPTWVGGAGGFARLCARTRSCRFCAASKGDDGSKIRGQIGNVKSGTFCNYLYLFCTEYNHATTR